MNASFTHTLFTALCAFTFTITTLGAALAQEPVAEDEAEAVAEVAAAATEVVIKAAAAAVAEAALKAKPAGEAEEKPKVYHFAEDDLETGRVLGDTLKAGSYAGKCLLVTVISATESYHRDLAATVQGDLADGALMLRRNLVNEIGTIAFKAGPNSEITLQEDNSTFLYTAMTEKARGKGIEEFARNAAQAGFLVTYESNVECLGTARDEDLKKAAEAHIEALRSKREKMAEIAKR